MICNSKLEFPFSNCLLYCFFCLGASGGADITPSLSKVLRRSSTKLFCIFFFLLCSYHYHGSIKSMEVEV